MLKLTNTGQETGAEPNFGMNNLLLDGNINWEWIEQQDWVQDMAACPQDKIWHAEGDVWTHTKMVMEELVKLPAYQERDGISQYALLLAALLHDIAKPICTEEIKGRIRSPKHAKIGAKVVRQMLWEADFELRERVCSLVRLHGLPIWVLNKGHAEGAVTSSSLRISNEELSILTEADMRGRICLEEDNNHLERVELFRLFAEEQECYQTPRSFYNAHSKFKFFQKRDVMPSHIYDDTEFQITVLCGMPGSGKDTYANQLDLPMVSLDEIRKKYKISPRDKDGQGRVAHYAYDLAKEYCRKKQSFVWNSTNLTELLRNRIVRTLGVYNPYFKLVYLETSWKNILKERKSIIPERKLINMRKMMDMPMPHEVHEVEYHRR